MDVDKDGDIDYIDLALLFGFWFGGSLILILCYFVYDVCDRIGRKERNEKEMLDSIDNYVALGDSDSEVEEITIDNGDCVHYTINTPCHCITPPPCQRAGSNL